MGTTERYYSRWIKEISKRLAPGEIEKHIIYHAADLNDPTRNLPESWIASMYNLLHLYEEKHKFHSQTSEQLFKLANKHYKYKGWTPPPGGKIPSKVKLTAVVLGKKKRPGEKAVTVKELRSLGRGGIPRWSKQDESNKQKSLKKTERLFKHNRK